MHPHNPRQKNKPDSSVSKRNPERSYPQKRKRKPASLDKLHFAIAGIILLVIGVIVGVLIANSLQKPAVILPTQAVFNVTDVSAAESVSGTLPATWTPTATLPPVTATALPLATPTSEPVEVVSTPQMSLRRDIVNVDSLPLLVWPGDETKPVIEYAPRGAVHTVLKEGYATNADGEYGFWWFIADGYGWIPSEIDGVPTTLDYTPELLARMIADMDDRMRADRGNPMLDLQKGWMYYAQGNYGPAISEISRAIRQREDDDDSRFYEYRGRVYFDLGDFERALHDFNQAIELGLEEASVYNRRALVYRNLGMHKEARQDLGTAVQLNPSYGMLYNQIGELISLQDPLDPAQLQFYNLAIQFADGYPYAYRNRANYYRLTGDFDDHVILDYTTAFNLVPNELDILRDRAVTFSLRGDVIRARTDFNRLIEMDSSYADAYIGRASGHYALGDTRAAIDDLLIAIRLDPKSELAHYNLGVFLQEEQQYLAALYCYNRVLEINPTHRSALFNRSQIYEAIGGFDERSLMAYPNIEALITPIP